jgi:hypothetical protein
MRSDKQPAVEGKMIAIDSNLNWKQIENWREAILGEWPNDGVRFSLSRYISCYRRGQWRLLVEVCSGPHHHEWGCFDEADQPMRWYHSEQAALSEAQAIADILWKDRRKHDNP